MNIRYLRRYIRPLTSFVDHRSIDEIFDGSDIIHIGGFGVAGIELHFSRPVQNVRLQHNIGIQLSSADPVFLFLVYFIQVFRRMDSYEVDLLMLMVGVMFIEECTDLFFQFVGLIHDGDLFGRSRAYAGMGIATAEIDNPTDDERCH